MRLADLRGGAMTVAVTGALLAAGNASPGVTAIGPVRRAFLPRLSGVGAAHHVALTFDDGPDPVSTPRFLAVLAQYRVRATFFMLGSMLQRAPVLASEVVAAGHELGVHGFEHRMLLGRSPRATFHDVARARDLVGQITGSAPRFYRPPYGVLTVAALHTTNALSLQPVLWTSWGKDWTTHATPESVRRKVTRGPLAGSTILLHDSDCTSAPGAWRSALGALPRILDHCNERGLQVGRLGEHFPST